MNDESDLITKLMEETIAENVESSMSQPLSREDILNLHDKLFQAFPINIYDDFIRVTFKLGAPIDIPRGLSFFHNEEQVYNLWKEYSSFEMNIIDETFKMVISDHLFVAVDKAIIFNHEEQAYIVFYGSEYEERVWGHIQDLKYQKIKKTA